MQYGRLIVLRCSAGLIAMSSEPFGGFSLVLQWLLLREFNSHIRDLRDVYLYKYVYIMSYGKKRFLWVL